MDCINVRARKTIPLVKLLVKLGLTKGRGMVTGETVFTFKEKKKHHKLILIAKHRLVIVLMYTSLFVK